MNRKKRQGGFLPPVVGGSSLLVMFAVLSLVTFAVLSLSSVKAGERLAAASEDAVMDYYAADLEAERILAELRGGRIPEGVLADGSEYVYRCPVSETRELHVKVRLDGERWEVLQWNVISSVDWTTEDTIDVWDGTIPELEE